MGDPFGRLLLATEGSEFDSGAQALAFALARRNAQPLAVVMPVASNPEFEMVAPQFAARAEADAAKRVAALTDAARAAGIEIDLRLRRGPEPWLEIVEEARERAADLLVIRRRGRRGLLANLLIGEMVSAVLDDAPCSLLIAPRSARLWSSPVVVGIEPQDADDALLALGVAIAADSALALHAVAAVARDADVSAARQTIDAALARHQPAAADAEVRVGSAPQAVIDAARAHAAGLIIVGRHRHALAGQMTLGSVARRVIGLAECPVFVYADNATTTRTG